MEGVSIASSLISTYIHCFRSPWRPLCLSIWLLRHCFVPFRVYVSFWWRRARLGNGNTRLGLLSHGHGTLDLWTSSVRGPLGSVLGPLGRQRINLSRQMDVVYSSRNDVIVVFLASNRHFLAFNISKHVYGGNDVDCWILMG